MIYQRHDNGKQELQYLRKDDQCQSCPEGSLIQVGTMECSVPPEVGAEQYDPEKENFRVRLGQ